MKNSLISLSVSTALAFSVVGTTPALNRLLPQGSLGIAHAQGIDGFFQMMGRDLGLTKKPQRGKKKPNKTQNAPGVGLDTVLQTVGVGLIAGGILGGDAAPLIAGSLLVAAPTIFQQDMKKRYGRDQTWAGCINCNQKRLLVRPGSQVSNAKQAEIAARIKNDVKDIQGALAQLGFYTKTIDGDYGPGSRKAASLFQQSLMDEPTGKLSASQRRELFTQAQAKGFEPQFEVAKASLRQPSTLTPPQAVTLPPTQLPVEPQSSIKEFKLAQSQFAQFTENVLLTGTLTAVKQAKLLPDGQAEIIADDGVVKILPLASLDISKHSLSDSWIQVTAHSNGGPEPAILNTIDHFKDPTEAEIWMEKAKQRLSLIEKLIAPKSVSEPDIIIAKAAPSIEPPAPPPIDAAGNDVVAAATDAARAAPTEAPTPLPNAPEPESAVQLASIKPAVAPTPTVDPLASVSVQGRQPTEKSPEQCARDVYISFTFPTDTKSISHYNITPPEGTLMMDNGDTTAYFAGDCVQGSYDYKFVVVSHDEKQKKWDSTVHEGQFELASLAGQCEVSLGNPSGSASLQCY